MKRFLFKVFRYPAVDLYMLLGFFIAFVSLFVGLSLYERIWEYEAESQEYQYRSVYSGTIRYIDCENDYITSVDSSARVYLADVVLSISTSESEIVFSTIVWLTNNTASYPILEGKWFDDTKDNLQIIVGREILNSGSYKIGDTMILEGEEYTIQGVVGTEKSSLYSDCIVLSVNHLGCNTQQNVLLQEKRLVVESNQTDAEKIYHSVKNDMLKKANELFFADENGEIRAGREHDYAEIIIFGVLYVFALFHCLIVVDVWTYERKYEIALKKSLGYSDMRLLSDLFKQLVGLVTLAALCCFSLQLIMRKIGKSFLGISLELSVKNISIILAFVILSTSLCLIVPLEETKKNNCETLKEH